MNGFPPGVADKIGYYVYCLRDPMNRNEVFYVGKGCGDRVFEHARAAIECSDPDDRIERIQKIIGSGNEVNYEIIRHGLTEEMAFEVESAIIDYIGIDCLSNKVVGHHVGTRGKMSVGDLVSIYGAQELKLHEPSILITINKLYRRNMSQDEIYDITRGNWVIGERRKKAKYGFSVYNGIVRGVYEIHSWMQVVGDRMGGGTRGKRWCFVGTPALDKQHYLGGSVSSYIVRGAQNPIKYINC